MILSAQIQVVVSHNYEQILQLALAKCFGHVPANRVADYVIFER